MAKAAFRLGVCVPSHVLQVFHCDVFKNALKYSLLPIGGAADSTSNILTMVPCDKKTFFISSLPTCLEGAPKKQTTFILRWYKSVALLALGMYSWSLYSLFHKCVPFYVHLVLIFPPASYNPFCDSVFLQRQSIAELLAMNFLIIFKW